MSENGNGHEMKLKAVLRRYEEAHLNSLTPAYTQQEMGILVWEMGLMQRRIDGLKERDRALMRFTLKLMRFAEGIGEAGELMAKTVNDIKRSSMTDENVRLFLQDMVEESDAPDEEKDKVYALLEAASLAAEKKHPGNRDAVIGEVRDTLGSLPGPIQDMILTRLRGHVEGNDCSDCEKRADCILPELV